jgi:hypothetical protein
MEDADPTPINEADTCNRERFGLSLKIFQVLRGGGIFRLKGSLEEEERKIRPGFISQGAGPCGSGPY